MEGIRHFGRGSARTLGTHRDYGLEIIYLEKGALNWHVQGRVERVKAGSLFFSLPWEEHGSVDEFEPGHYWHWVQFGLSGRTDRPRSRFGFHPAFGIPTSEARQLSEMLVKCDRHAHPATTRAAWLIPTLVEELTHPGRYGNDYLAALGRLAILELGRCIESGADNRGADEESLRRVESFAGQLRQTCDQAWTLEAMAEHCDLGRSRFTTLCRRLTGDSPLVLVNRLRIDRAKALLRETGDSITDIAFACGFSSSQYFARVFRGFTGMDARSYRLKHARISPGAS
ncbi:MAG: AraC family transcriptional regulator [Opitutaceae bacterium]|nr:AraC family transcriptional regulator [Cephaloticoccus sp.]MCP5530695.1 AraC family transcriptional regulator [Opitutaceae bacterium]